MRLDSSGILDAYRGRSDSPFSLELSELFLTSKAPPEDMIPVLKHFEYIVSW